MLIDIYRAKRAEKLSQEQVAQLQHNRFQALVKHVIGNSRFYRTYYGDHGITADKIGKVELEALPTINKALMMEHFDDFVCDPRLKKAALEQFVSNPGNRGQLYLNKFHIIRTSGTTGTLGLFVYSRRDWNVLKSLVMTRVSKSRLSLFKKIRLAYIGDVEGNYAGITLTRVLPKFFFEVLPVSVNAPLKEILANVDAFKPDVLTGYSSGIHMLAEAQLRGDIDIAPHRMVCSADPLTPAMRQAISSAFGIDPVAYYAASESIGIASDMTSDHRIHQGLHIFNDWHCFEIVDREHRKVAYGEPGKLLLSNLYNYTQPIIRYEMNDEIILEENTCQHGLPFPLIKNIAGRKEDFLWFKKQDQTLECIHPLVITNFWVEGLQRFQFVQTRENFLVIKAIINGDAATIIRRIKDRMNQILQDKQLADTVTYEVEIVDTIPANPNTGKNRLILALKP
ncbi:phenylacetate--CoA ligase family protein [Chitinophaga nivalis]|uniref:Phenylacetate--CoA ligase family protein n=1 Tax=Chitinophaga nivalis TaxID=2991709 RepID=A0ABT3IMR9_9BACT|nr:hypothetical protein [Chitinophaga nivalis]MCW3465042.1 hypothetical protein [Chitinophaga nivalis]MCW3485266.1 hypothetical protein [Chitinophaga nivalis]